MKLKALSLGLLLVAWCGTAWAQVEQNLLVNGKFLTDTNGWTIVSGTIGVQQGYGCRFCMPNSVMKQSFTTVTGQRYRLRFMQTAVAAGMIDKKLTVKVAGKTQSFDFKLPAVPFQQAYDHPAEPKMMEFVATGPQTELMFIGNSGDDHGCIISNVSVTAVTPESDQADAIKSMYGSMTSAVSRHMTDYLDRVVAPDFVLTAPDGSTQSRADFLDTLKKPGTRVSWILKDLHINGSDTIVQVERSLSGSVSRTEDHWTQSHGNWVLTSSKVLEAQP